MAYERSVKRYKNWYAKLLRLYPPSYRARFGSSMEQTFNDLLRERNNRNGSLVALALSTFADTLVAIIKEEIAYMNPKLRKYWVIVMLLIAAITIPGTAFLTKGTAYQNAYLWVFVAWLIVYGLVEAGMRSKGKDR